MFNIFFSRILCVDDADSFYTTMGSLTQDMLDTSLLNPDSLIKVGKYSADILFVTRAI